MEIQMDRLASRELGVVLGRVSVVTAVYNAASTLVQCIESVIAQDYHDVEFILMDGGSTDGSIDILRSYGNRIHWKSEPDKGIYDAWNKSLALASGEWIAFLGADDCYLPGAISTYMHFINQMDADYVSSQVRWLHTSGRSQIIGEAWRWPRFQSFMTTAHVGSMHRYTLYQRYGFYNPTYRIVGDYELLLRPRASLRAFFMPIVTVEMQAGGASDSFAALSEARRAKTTTGGRNVLRATIDLFLAQAKLLVRRLIARQYRRG